MRHTGRCLIACLLGMSAWMPLSAARGENGPATRPARPPLVVIATQADDRVAVAAAGNWRCAADPLLTCVALAPVKGGTAFTTQESPSLFFYLTKPSQLTIQITLRRDLKKEEITRPEDAMPLLQMNFSDPLVAGIQRIDLARAGVKLQAGVRYKWFVSILSPTGHDSENVVSQGVIEHIAPSADLQKDLAAARDDLARAYAYAARGVFYDALASVSDQIEKNRAPDEQDELRTLRANLVKEIIEASMPDNLKRWSAAEEDRK